MSQERYVDRTEIAFLLGVEPRTITNWVKNHPDFPSRVSGKERKFPVLKCIRWKTDRDVADAISSMEPAPADNFSEAELRKAIADAEMAELKVRKFKAELVDASIVGTEVARAYARVAARLKSTPGEFAPQILHPLTMPEAVAVLRRLVTTALTALQSEFLNEDIREADEENLPEEGAA